jgi:hypothetical protein
VSDTEITCTTPSGTPEATVNVVVESPYGHDTLPNGWTYDAAP